VSNGNIIKSIKPIVIDFNFHHRRRPRTLCRILRSTCRVPKRRQTILIVVVVCVCRCAEHGIRPSSIERRHAQLLAILLILILLPSHLDYALDFSPQPKSPSWTWDHAAPLQRKSHYSSSSSSSSCGRKEEQVVILHPSGAHFESSSSLLLLQSLEPRSIRWTSSWSKSWLLPVN